MIVYFVKNCAKQMLTLYGLFTKMLEVNQTISDTPLLVQT